MTKVFGHLVKLPVSSQFKRFFQTIAPNQKVVVFTMAEDNITKFINTVAFFKGFKGVEKQKLVSRANFFEVYKEKDI